MNERWTAYRAAAGDVNPIMRFGGVLSAQADLESGLRKAGHFRNPEESLHALCVRTCISLSTHVPAHLKEAIRIRNEASHDAAAISGENAEMAVEAFAEMLAIISPDSSPPPSSESESPGAPDPRDQKWVTLRTELEELIQIRRACLLPNGGINMHAQTLVDQRVDLLRESLFTSEVSADNGQEHFVLSGEGKKHGSDACTLAWNFVEASRGWDYWSDPEAYRERFYGHPYCNLEALDDPLTWDQVDVLTKPEWRDLRRRIRGTFHSFIESSDPELRGMFKLALVTLSDRLATWESCRTGYGPDVCDAGIALIARFSWRYLR